MPSVTNRCSFGSDSWIRDRDGVWIVKNRNRFGHPDTVPTEVDSGLALFVHSNPSIFIVRTLCAYVKVGYCAVFVLIAICNILEEVPFNPDLDCFIQASAVLGLELDLTVGRALHQLDSATNAL